MKKRTSRIKKRKRTTKIKNNGYDFKAIEKKWQKQWERKKIFEVKEQKRKKKFYVLEMYPYPSSSGLHMGHAFNYTIGDVYARFKRMQGLNVLYPMGYDSFGLPAENAAIQAGRHPKKFTEEAIKNFINQQKELGLSYDWSRVIMSHNPSYYKWNQYFFLKFMERGLVYRKKAPVNFCLKCNTVLANEQVHNGKCWRHKDIDVEIKQLEQWFMETTKYADELLEKVDSLQWPEKIKIMQKNWIGKSHGVEINFKIEKKLSENTNCIIVHGCPSNAEKAMNPETRTYDKHWIQWIKRKLEEKGIKTEAPLMPEPWKPIYENWKKGFDKLNVDENTILIGHSCGCAFLVRWLGDTKKKINKLILVAPWKIPKDNDFKKKFYDYAIKDSIKSQVNEIIIFTSNNEAADGKKSVKIFHEALESELIELKNKGHFVLDDMGTEEFPELLNKIVLNEIWPIFTTRPDTIFGVTFMVISSQHPRLMEIVAEKQKKEVENFLKKIKTTSQKSIKEFENLEKEGVFTGSYAVNPLTNEKIPVCAGNFVLADYGSGMIMAVPAHDQRDFEFAKKYKIPIKIVISPENYELNADKMTKAYTSEGTLINSEKFNGINSKEAIKIISDYIEEKKLGKRTMQYKLKDWLISRQRYWGTPIPIIYCEKCGVVPVPEKKLPVLLPEKVKFGKGNPLATNEKFVNIKCPKCKSGARRETDTMDTFFDSSWYFLRYCDNKNKKQPFDKRKIAYWMPVNQYIGGAEHACMHLIYARFFTKVLCDLKFLNFDEPFTKLFNQGMLHGPDGYVMSKSRGNVVLPEEISKKYSIDTARLFLVSFASPDKDIGWSDKGIQGGFRFVKKLMDYFEKIKIGKSCEKIESKLNSIIKEVTQDISEFRYNLAVIKIRNLFESFGVSESKEVLQGFLKLLSPFCPHIAEELWHRLGNKSFISLEKWPVADEKKINPEFEKQEKAVKKTIEDIKNIFKILKDKENKEPQKIYIYVLPKELTTYQDAKKQMQKSLNVNLEIFSVTDEKKHDPKNKAGKAKPGKPAIFVE